MTFLEVLVEGSSDARVVREILERRFRRREHEHFRVHAHAGKGKRTQHPRTTPAPARRGVPDVLHAKLRGYSGVFTPSREAAGREELERLEAALARLSDEHREVVVLARIVGLSSPEIAERMQRSEGAVRVLLHRALARLAIEMG